MTARVRCAQSALAVRKELSMKRFSMLAVGVVSACLLGACLMDGPECEPDRGHPWGGGPQEIPECRSDFDCYPGTHCRSDGFCEYPPLVGGIGGAAGRGGSAGGAGRGAQAGSAGHGGSSGTGATTGGAAGTGAGGSLDGGTTSRGGADAGQ